MEGSWPSVPSEPAGGAPLDRRKDRAPGRGATCWMPDRSGARRSDVPLGRRVMVVSDLLLTPAATATSTAVTTELARALDTWDGPGILDHRRQPVRPDRRRRSALAESQRPSTPIRHWLRRCAGSWPSDGRRVIRQTGTTSPGADERRRTTVDRAHRPRCRAGRPARSPSAHRPPDAGGAGRARRVHQPLGGSGRETNSTRRPTPSPGASALGRQAGGRWPPTDEDAPWLVGLNRLSDPAALSALRRLPHPLPPPRPHAWWLLVPFVVALLSGWR